MTLDEIIEKTGNVVALINPHDKEVLYKYASLVPENGVIVDIGTYAGGSSFLMALATHPSTKVYTVDPVPNIYFMGGREVLGLRDRVIYLNKTSEEAFKDWDGTPIDLLFIDSMHNYDMVKGDLHRLGSFVRSGGYILAHDYQLYPGVKEAMDEAVNEKYVELVEMAESEYRGKKIGIYVVKKK